jgi:hypothetical protein
VSELDGKGNSNRQNMKDSLGYFNSKVTTRQSRKDNLNPSELEGNPLRKIHHLLIPTASD